MVLELKWSGMDPAGGVLVSFCPPNVDISSRRINLAQLRSIADM